MRTTFTRRFSAAHRLKDDDSPCRRIHGHNYIAVITVDCAYTWDGMVVPAEKIKEVVDEVYDHRLILEEGDVLEVGYQVPLTGFPEDEGRIQFQPMDFFIVRVPEAPTTEMLANQIAWDVRKVVRQWNKRANKGYVQVTLHETPTISAEACAAWS